MTAIQTGATYAIDPAHSNVEFAVRHLMLSKVRGRFSAIKGAVVLGIDDLPASVTAEIEVSSIDTREPQRDAHLKSPDFLDAEKFPLIRFTSTAVAIKSGDGFSITGNLEIHGTSNPVTLTGQFFGHATDPWGNKRVGFEAKVKINRKEFGLTWNQALETGGVMVGEDVEIDLQVEAVAA